MNDFLTSSLSTSIELRFSQNHRTFCTFVLARHDPMNIIEKAIFEDNGNSSLGCVVHIRGVRYPALLEILRAIFVFNERMNGDFIFSQILLISLHQCRKLDVLSCFCSK